MSLVDLLEVNKNESEDTKKPKNFRAKILGIIYEDIVEIGLKELYGFTIKKRLRRGPYDFELEKDGKQFVAEAKCWPAYLEGTKKWLDVEYLRKIRDKQIEKGMDSFREFLKGEGETKGKERILLWWNGDDETRETAKKEFGFYEVYYVKRILEELKRSGSKNMKQYVSRCKSWAVELFDALEPATVSS